MLSNVSLRNIYSFFKLARIFVFKNLNKKVLFKVFCYTFILFVFLFICFSSFWTQKTFRNLNVEEVLFSLYLPLENVEQELVDSFKKESLFLSLKITFFCFLMIFISFKNFHRRLFRYLNKFFVFLLFVFGIFSFYKFYNVFRVGDIIELYFSDSKYIEENYVDPREVKMVFPKKKKNLIHIYLESVENSYFSKELGGVLDENLLPELNDLLKEGISFSNTSFNGGPLQVQGTTCSISAFVAMESGIPLKAPLRIRGSYGEKGTFLPGIITLNDILKQKGYSTSFMLGSHAHFMGIGDFFKVHSTDNIFDYEYARENGFIVKDYKRYWGFEDDLLYEFAKDEILRLYNLKKPFSLVIETADTHGPDGFLSPRASRAYDSKYMNVVRHSSRLIYFFLDWLRSQDFFKDTVVVITGDHLYQYNGKDVNKWFPENYTRTIYNVILNSEKQAYKSKNRLFSSFDFFPTILSSLGVKIAGDRLGLGTNLFPNRKTLLERDGFDMVNSELRLNSNFYNEKFIKKQKN